MKTPYFNSAAPKVGDIVYPYCQPQKAGRIIAIGQGTISIGKPGHANPVRTHSGTVVRILQANGTEYDQAPMGLQCFRTLVEDHERKAQKHRAVLEKITGA